MLKDDVGNGQIGFAAQAKDDAQCSRVHGCLVLDAVRDSTCTAPTRGLQGGSRSQPHLAKSQKRRAALDSGLGHVKHMGDWRCRAKSESATSVLNRLRKLRPCCRSRL